jgi:hypothetical protein
MIFDLGGTLVQPERLKALSCGVKSDAAKGRTINNRDFRGVGRSDTPEVGASAAHSWL